MNCIIDDMDSQKKNNGVQKTPVPDEGKMAITKKGLWLLLGGLGLMVLGYILMTGGGSDDPKVFSEAMFDARRLVAAPLLVVAGLGVEVFAIMKVWKKE